MYKRKTQSRKLAFWRRKKFSPFSIQHKIRLLPYFMSTKDASKFGYDGKHFISYQFHLSLLSSSSPKYALLMPFIRSDYLKSYEFIILFAYLPVGATKPKSIRNCEYFAVRVSYCGVRENIIERVNRKFLARIKTTAKLIDTEKCGSSRTRKQRDAAYRDAPVDRASAILTVIHCQNIHKYSLTYGASVISQSGLPFRLTFVSQLTWIDKNATPPHVTSYSVDTVASKCSLHITNRRANKQTNKRMK